MSRASLVNRVRDYIYGTGLGEKPSIRRAHAAANSSQASGVATFLMASGEGDKIKAGNVLSVVDFSSASSESTSYCFYVLSVATDTVTAVAEYMGGPAISATTALNGALFEQNPLVTQARIHQAIDSIFSAYLWPSVWKYGQRTVTPNMSTLQSPVPSAVEAVERGYQVISNIAMGIDVGLAKNTDTTVVATTGTLLVYDPYDATTIYLTTRERLALGDESTYPQITDMVAAGAAAICIDSAVTAAAQEKSKKESTERQIRSQELWQAFLRMRSTWADDLTREYDQIVVERG
jgi:hypothetical protein